MSMVRLLTTNLVGHCHYLCRSFLISVFLLFSLIFLVIVCPVDLFFRAVFSSIIGLTWICCSKNIRKFGILTYYIYICSLNLKLTELRYLSMISMKHFSPLFLLALMLLLPSQLRGQDRSELDAVRAEISQAQNYEKYEYVEEGETVDDEDDEVFRRDYVDGFYATFMYVDVTVHADRTYDIVEYLDVNFVEPHHGLVRDIPTRFYVNRDVSEAQDSTKFELKYNRVKVDDIHVSEEFTEEDVEAAKSLRIGSSDRYVEGDHRYVINYRLSLPNDRVPYSDHFFHSVLGSEWTCSFDTVAFAIHFDKEVPDASLEKLKIYVGEETSTDDRSQAVVDSIGNYIIEGSIYEMPARWALTIDMPLPEGYFPTDDLPIWILLSRIAAALTIVVLLWLVYQEFRGDDKVIPVVTFQPSEEMTSADIGSLVDGEVDDEDLLSMVPWFAAHGYLAIENEGKKTQLRKLAPLPDGAPDYQRKLFDAFFCGRDTFTFGDSSSFGMAWETAKECLAKKYEGKLNNRPFALHLLLATFLISLTLCFAQAGPDGWICGGLVNFLLVLYIVAVSKARSFWKDQIHLTGCANLILAFFAFCTIGFGLFIGLGLLITVPSVFEDSYLPYPLLYGLMAVMLLVITFQRRLLRMSDYRRERLAEIEGLREFIRTAEKDRLQMMLDKDERYFYNILPFAMAFGLVDKWAEKFRDLNVRQIEEFGSTPVTHISTCLASRSWSSHVSSSVRSSHGGSGGSSGSARGSRGGYSGGGSGGGGGRSW